MSRKYFVVLGLFLTAGFLFFNVNSVFAITYSWSGGGDGMTWTDPANWGTTLYPGQNANDDVIIATSTSATGAHAVHATSTIANGVNTLQVKNGWTLYVGGTALGASSTVSIIGTSTLKLSTSTQGAGTLNLAQTDAGTPLMLPATATFTPATGTVAYIGGGTATRYVATTTFYNLSLTPTSTASVVTYTFGAGHTVAQSATTTVSNVFTISAAGKADFLGLTDLLLSGSGTVFSKANGDFIQSSKVVYSSTSNTNIATGTYANLELTGGSSVVKTLLGNTTATSTVTIPSSSTLAISTYTFTATGATWTNSGTVTEGTGGKIVLAGVGVLSNSAGGSAVTDFGNFDSYPVIHIQITDTSLNLVAATAETKTATVTGTSGITDSETVTLTETTVSSGIFRGSLTVGLSASDVADKLDYQGGGTVSYTWTDSQDSADTETATASFTGTSPGGGGGGGGGAVTVAATPAVPATPATPAVPTVVAATPAVPATPAAPSLDNVQTKIASVVVKIAALPAKPSADDLASVQAEIAAILVDIQAIQAAQPSPQGVALGFNFVRPLALGLRHADVSNLQKALKTDSSVYPEGLVTGYFGPATLRAVQKFQEKYGIASSGTSGYGNVGPKTREKLNELYGGK